MKDALFDQSPRQQQLFPEIVVSFAQPVKLPRNPAH
jgi:hypothetical protein